MNIKKLARISREYHENYENIQLAMIAMSHDNSAPYTAKTFGVETSTIHRLRWSKGYRKILKPKGGPSLYEIQKLIAAKIKAGKYPPGSRLTGRMISEEYNISVRSAYNISSKLKDQGLLVTHPGPTGGNCIPKLENNGKR